jgi:hypothetical protein
LQLRSKERKIGSTTFFVLSATRCAFTHVISTFLLIKKNYGEIHKEYFMEYENNNVRTRELQIDLKRENCITFINIAEKTQ